MSPDKELVCYQHVGGSSPQLTLDTATLRGTQSERLFQQYTEFFGSYLGVKLN